MDLFSQIANATAAAAATASAAAIPSAAAPSASAASSQESIVTVALEKIKKRTVTVIYNIALELDTSVRTPEELLSKLKKKICYSNGFIRKPEDVESEQEDADDEEDSDASGSSNEGSSDDEESSEKKPRIRQLKEKKVKKEKRDPQVGLAYVINGNHSNVICRYIYSLGVKSIIRTGTA